MTTDCDHLSITELRRYLDTEAVGRHIYLFGTVDSTNAVLQGLAEHEAEDIIVEIKWPNDVVVDGRKLGGALVDYATVGDQVSHVILGIGVNLNVARAELDAALGAEAAGAVSVSELVGGEIDRNRFVARFLNRLEKWHRIFMAEGPVAVHAAWRSHDALRGRRLEIRSGATAWRGCGCGVDADGSLLVEDAEGNRRRVVSGAIRLLHPEQEEAR